MLRSMFLFLAFSFLATAGFAQVDDTTEETTPISSSTSNSTAATVNYTVGDLEKLNKLELTTIYIVKLKRLHNLLPFIPFQKLDPKTPNDLKIPSVKMNDKAIEQMATSRESYNTTVEGALNSVIPYADKKAIIESIIFIQHFINKVELIGLGMYSISDY